MDERASALAARLAEVRARVSGLRRKVDDASAAEQAALKEADFTTADAIRSDAQDAAVELGTTVAELSALEEAERSVSRERQRARWQEELAAVEGAKADALEHAQRLTAEILAGLQAVGDAVRAGLAAETTARQLQQHANGLLDLLDPLPETDGMGHARVTAYVPAPVSELLSGSPILHALRVAAADPAGIVGAGGR